MKRIISFVLVIAMTLSLAACSDATVDTGAGQETTTEEVTTEEAHVHSWTEATCTTPKTCQSCNVMEGSAAGHDWKAATCTSPKTCQSCNATEGSAAGHKYSGAECLLCDYVAECLGTFDASANQDGTITAYLYTTEREDVYRLAVYGTGEMGSRSPWSTLSDKIKQVEIGEGITATDGLDRMVIEKLILPSTLKIAGGFYGTTFEQKVVLPDSVEKISSFQTARFLQGVVLPDTVEVIGHYAFMGAYVGDGFTLPKNLKQIGDCAFENAKGLSKLVIPENVESIGKRAFSGTAIEITINSNIKQIGLNAFSNHSDLEVQRESHISCKIPQSNYGNGIYAGNDENPYLILIGTIKKEITSLEIHPDTKIIYNHAINNCLFLKEVSIPDGVTCIGYYAIAYCNQLEKISIENNVKYLGGNIFAYTHDSLGISFAGTIAQWEQIEKESGWYYDGIRGHGGEPRVIHCTDGNLTVPNQ